MLNLIYRGTRRERSLVFVVHVVPVVPTFLGNNVVEIRIRVDNSGVLAQGPAHVDWARTSHPTPHESKARLLVDVFPLVGSYRAEFGSYGVHHTILPQQTDTLNVKSHSILAYTQWHVTVSWYNTPIIGSSAFEF